MSSRVSCWLNGHDWMSPGRKTYSDPFGNIWRLQHCGQCGARHRVLERAWNE